jgi:bifunctional NMN adenylyltransferase/nudix hydrolase
MSTENLKVAAAPARFQVPYLHEGHTKLIDKMLAEADKVVILLGTTPVRMSTKNPYSFEVRKRMIEAAYPTVEVFEVADVPHNDTAWSASVDNVLRAYNTPDVILYGGRDSFIPSYNGIYMTLEVSIEEAVSGSELRASVMGELVNTEDFRRGILYAANDRYPISYQTVDAIVMDREGYILLGRKPFNPKFCLIGGFVDTTDASLEAAVMREVREETGLEVNFVNYTGSFRVDDGRYRGEVDQIMTSLFVAHYDGARTAAVASDDIEEVKWVHTSKVNLEEIVPAHVPLLGRFLGR